MTESQGDPTQDVGQTGNREMARQLDHARRAGSWIGWVGIALGLFWMIGAGLGAISYFGGAAIAALSPVNLILGGFGVVIPALLLITSGYMARTNRRASAANAIVLEAAAQLLSPSESAASASDVLAVQMSASAAEVDRSMAHALAAMKAMAGEIGDERQRLEQVSYATADNARELAARLAEERNALEGLARDLRTQISEMSEAIPRQAELMVSAARMAGEEVARADEALERQLAEMTKARDSLSEKLGQLDTIAVDAAKRTEDVTFAVTRVEQKLDESRRTVDAAVRAGEMAAAAATATGDALKDAVSVALDGARSANLEISQRTREASEMAARDLAALRMTAEQAGQAVKTAGMAARAETDMVERRLSQMSGAMHRTTIAAENLVHAAPDAATPKTNGHANGHTPETILPAVTPALAPLVTGTPEIIAGVSEDELFEASADQLSAAQAPLELGRDLDPKDADPLMLRQRFDDDGPVNGEAVEVEVNGVDTSRGATLSTPLATSAQVAPASNDTAWREMLADIDREDTPQRSREETAEELVVRLEASGISLPDALRPKDKKRIASAARKGETQRRGATLDAAGRQVERVNSRLHNDRELMLLARDFITMEKEDALVALEQTHKTNRNASSRLAAFLLVEAALGD